VTHPLDADTAIEPLTPTRWRARVHDRWWVVLEIRGTLLAQSRQLALIRA
jgi:hypothetical protein